MKLKKFIAVLFYCLIAAIPVAANDVYDSVPTFSPYYYAGKLKYKVLNEALKELNYIRELIGVPNNVTLNSDYTNKAQHGAVLLDAIDRLTHTPSKPSDMNESFYKLGYEATTHGNLSEGKVYRDTYINGVKSKTEIFGGMTLSRSLKSCMDDSDPSNISRVGHRRWLMNPRLKQVGFGLSTRRGYAVTYLIEEFGKTGALSPKEYAIYKRWLKWPIRENFISWPSSKRPHPLTYFYKNSAWSVTLNSEVFEKINRKNLRVKLTRLSDNRAWNFDSFTSNGDFYIAEKNIAYDECIIFRPNNISGYKPGEQWRVEIFGLKSNSRNVNIAYNVRFSNEKTGFDYDIPESDSKL